MSRIYTINDCVCCLNQTSRTQKLQMYSGFLIMLPVCRLQELPVTIGALTDLRVMFVGHNQLAQLPGSISRLQQLQTLHAGTPTSMTLRCHYAPACINYTLYCA